MEEGGKEEDEQLCPLCYESMDLTEKHFRPCKCGYQVCLWCFHDVFEKLNGKCPACRTPYNKERLESTALDPKLVAVAKEEKKRRKEKQKPPMDRLSSIKQLQTRELLLSKGVQSSVDSDLQNVRIVQRNLVYVIGIPPQIAREEILRKKEYFGKFGRIIKIAINKKQMVGVGPKSSCSAYVTFKRDEDASAAIEEFNGRIIDGRTLKATFGTTKYCSFFLRNLVCSNPGCLYLHEFARPEDCFTKEDLVIIEKMGSLQYFQSSLAARSGSNASTAKESNVLTGQGRDNQHIQDGISQRQIEGHGKPRAMPSPAIAIEDRSSEDDFSLFSRTFGFEHAERKTHSVGSLERLGYSDNSDSSV